MSGQSENQRTRFFTKGNDFPGAEKPGIFVKQTFSLMFQILLPNMAVFIHKRNEQISTGDKYAVNFFYGFIFFLCVLSTTCFQAC